MEPKEKAEQLYWKYFQLVADGFSAEYIAKQCALYAVDEIIEEIEYINSTKLGEDFWKQVKEEIEKL